VKLVPLKELCSFKHGGTPSKACAKFWQGDIPWVSPKDMKSSLIADVSDHISEEAVSGSATSIVSEGAILVVVRSGILAHSLPIARVGRPVAFNQDIKAIVPSSELASADFLYWFLRAQASQVIARGVKKGATVHSVQSGFIESLLVPLPSMDEQRRVIDVLSRAEGIVRLRRESQKKAAELIPAIFIEMFGDPATNPKGWPIVDLGDLLLQPPVLGTMAKPTAELQPWLDLRVANIQGGRLVLDDRKWVLLSEEEVQRFELRADDIVLARAIGSLDHLGKAVVVQPDGQWTFDSHLMRLRLKQDELISCVFVTFLSTAAGRREFLKHTRRSAVQFNINGKEIRRLRLPLPPMDMQQNFIRAMEAAESILRQQSASLHKATATFDSLLARAFSTDASIIELAPAEPER
jgi:type I restriction enzyme S subunit